MQAQARAHRIGQTKAVKVYRLLTRKTYEMHMFHKASMKLGLDKAVLAHARNEQEAGDEQANSLDDSNKLNLQAKEIDELLKRGAYDIFRDDDTEATAVTRLLHCMIYNVRTTESPYASHNLRGTIPAQ